MLVQISALLTVAAVLLATPIDARPPSTEEEDSVPSQSSKAPWGKIKNLVVFGDSYTDEGRLSYFINHNGEAPPVGYIQPEGNNTASGGRSWPRFVVQNSGVTLYNYAVSGGSCSNEVTPRTLSLISSLFPSVLEYELPAFRADFPKDSRALPPAKTLYAIWIGTNDLAGDLLLSGIPNVGLPDYTSCVVEAMAQLFDHGARNFVLMNLAPLQHAPIYAPLSEGGMEGPDRYWSGKSGNTTAISAHMKDMVQSANEIFKYRIPIELTKGVLKGANIAIMDNYGLISDIRNNPANYLVGPQLNVTGYNSHCTPDGLCTSYRDDERDSFLWYDELHPSEQTHRIIGREFTKGLLGKPAEWMTFL